MNNPNLLQQALEKMDFNSSQNSLFFALEKLNHYQETNSLNLLQTILLQSCAFLNDSCTGFRENPAFLETALQTLNRGVVDKEILEVEEELPILPDLGEDILATETTPIAALFINSKIDEYKEPRSFILEKPAEEITPAVVITPVNTIKNNKIEPEIKKQTPPVSVTPSRNTIDPSYQDNALNFFINLPYEKALPRIKVVEQDSGEETHFRVLPAKQSTQNNERNMIENPIFAATLQAIQASGGTLPSYTVENDYKQLKSQPFFGTLPWTKTTA